MVKVGNISLDMTIQMILRDKGCLTKKQVKDYLRKVEITDEEFRRAWKCCEDWGFVKIANRFVENGKEVWTYEFRDDYNTTTGWFDKFIPKMWDILLDEGKHTTTTIVKITHRYRDEDKIIDAIKQIPIIINAEEVDDNADE